MKCWQQKFTLKKKKFSENAVTNFSNVLFSSFKTISQSVSFLSNFSSTIVSGLNPPSPDSKTLKQATDQRKINLFIDKFLSEIEKSGFEFDVAGLVNYFESVDITVTFIKFSKQIKPVFCTSKCHIKNHQLFSKIFLFLFFLNGFHRHSLKVCDSYFDLIFFALKNVKENFLECQKYEDENLSVSFVESKSEIFSNSKSFNAKW